MPAPKQPRSRYEIERHNRSVADRWLFFPTDGPGADFACADQWLISHDRVGCKPRQRSDRLQSLLRNELKSLHGQGGRRHVIVSYCQRDAWWRPLLFCRCSLQCERHRKPVLQRDFKFRACLGFTDANQYTAYGGLRCGTGRD